MKCPKCGASANKLELIANVCTTMTLDNDGYVNGLKYNNLDIRELVENIDDDNMEIYCPVCGNSFFADFNDYGELEIIESMKDHINKKEDDKDE